MTAGGRAGRGEDKHIWIFTQCIRCGEGTGGVTPERDIYHTMIDGGYPIPADEEDLADMQREAARGMFAGDFGNFLVEGARGEPLGTAESIPEADRLILINHRCPLGARRVPEREERKEK